MTNIDLTTRDDPRQHLYARLDENRRALIELCSALGRADSRNPPGDTTGMVQACRAVLDGVPGIEIEEMVSEHLKINLIARLSGGRPGPRLIMNGHLDTGPVPDPAQWTFPPFGGVVAQDRIYGRGIADMKAGIAAEVMALRTLAEFRSELAGELVLVLVADEGTGGRHGTQFVLSQRGELAGDAMLSADVGSPRIARIGEKGFLWIEIVALGRSAAAAHPHLGDNAIDHLIAALAAVKKIDKGASSLPAAIGAAVEKAAPLSEQLNGAGETRTLTGVTVNTGIIQGGIRVNNVPSRASARIDIRLPPGLTVREMQTRIDAELTEIRNVRWTLIDSADPNWTAPDAKIVQLLVHNANAIVQQPTGVSIRAGFSDARFFRERNVPSVVYGVTPHNGNAPDEYVLISELQTVYRVHACTAFDFLSRNRFPAKRGADEF
jgi:acetylornithine deacetylase/succinyl-diaminopimelate desuccinylase-like protein